MGTHEPQKNTSNNLPALGSFKCNICQTAQTTFIEIADLENHINKKHQDLHQEEDPNNR